MEKTAVCLGFTKDFEFAAGVVLLNFAKLHGKDSFDFVLYCDRDLPKLRRVFASLGIAIRIVKYSPPIPWVRLFSSRAIGYFSQNVLSKFEAFRLLGQYDRVLWLDYDIVIRRPLTDLLIRSDFDFAYQLSEGPASQGFHRAPLELNSQQRGMSAHLFVLRNTFPDHETSCDRLYEIFSEDPDNFFFPEQAAIDLLISEKDFIHFELDVTKYNALPEEGISDPNNLILHSWGPGKFWNDKPNPEWQSLYSEWVSLGGSEFSGAKSRVHKIHRQLRYLVAVIIWNLQNVVK